MLTRASKGSTVGRALSGDDGSPAEDGDAALVAREVQLSRRLTVTTIAGQIAVLVAVLGAWQLLSGSIASASTISSPWKVARLGAHWIDNGYLLTNARATVEEVIIGFVIGAAAGTVSGVLLGVSSWTNRVLSPYVNMLYALPKIALGPLFIVWFGIAMELKVVLAALFVYFLVLYNTWTGIRQVDADLVNVMRVMGASRLSIVRKVMLPSALVWVILGLRISFPQALIGAIIGELLASNQGLGYVINVSAQQYDVTGVLAAIVALVIIASVFDRLLAAVQRQFSKNYGQAAV